MHWLVLAPLALALAPEMRSQRTWVVDARGGRGSDFTDLPAALAAANHGDRILVRPGSYQGAQTDRGVSIAADTATVTTPLLVAGVPVGRSFALAGVSCGTIVCADNPGRVHFDRVTAQGTNPGGNVVVPALDVARCSAFTATGCHFFGGPTRIARSTAEFVGCDIVGAHAISRIKFGLIGTPAVIAADSTVVIARCRVEGGSGATHQFGAVPPSVAVDLDLCDAMLMGGPSESCRAGVGYGGLGASALRVVNGTTTVDPTLPLLASGPNPPIVGGPVSMRRMPALLAAGAPPGGRLDTELYAPAGQVAVLLAGLPRPPLPTPFGRMWLEVPAVVDVGPVGSTERRAVALAVPDETALRGLTLALQSASGDLVLANVGLSNAAVVVLN